MDQILHTPRLTLRALSVENAAPTARIMSHAIARWTGSWKGTETAEEVGERIARSLEAERAGLRFMRAVTLSGTGELIGWAGVIRLDAEPARGSLGYWLGEAWFGQGYAREAARAVVDAAWQALDLQVIEAAAQVANRASHRILLGLGMAHMGQRQEFATARGAADLCEWYELRRPPAAPPLRDGKGRSGLTVQLRCGRQAPASPSPSRPGWGWRQAVSGKAMEAVRPPALIIGKPTAATPTQPSPSRARAIGLSIRGRRRPAWP